MPYLLHIKMSPVEFVLFPDKEQLIVIFPPSSTVVMFGQTLMILSVKLEDKKITSRLTLNIKQVLPNLEIMQLFSLHKAD